MSAFTTTSTTTRTRWLRSAGRWMITFLGFPLGGYAALLLLGPIQSLWAAMVGGLITGAVLGVAQWLGFSRARPPAAQWIAATTVGMTMGLAVGATAVGFATSLTALVIQGAICGAAVGAAQAVVLRRRLRRLALVWPPTLAVLWAVGWAVTTAGGIQVEQQFTIFGSYGAIVVTALTTFLPLIYNDDAKTSS